MSRRYRGGFLNTALPVVTGQASTPGAWSLTDQVQYAASGVWPLSTAFGFVSGAEVAARTQTAIAADTAGNTYVAYRTNTTAANMDAVYLVKLDGNGDVVWQFRYSLSADTSSNTVFPNVLAIDFDSSGNLICGYIARYSSFASFGVLRITASDGSFISASRYRPSTASILENNLSLVRDNSGNIYVAFGVNVAGLGARAQICKIQLSDLAILWIQVVSSSTSTTADNGDVTSLNSLAISPDSNTIYLTTRSFTSNLPRLVVFDSNGNRTAAYTLNSGSETTAVPQVAADSAGDIYVSYRQNTGTTRMSIAKYTSAFAASWRVETSSSANPVGIFATGDNLTVGSNAFVARISLAGSVSTLVPTGVVLLSSSPGNFVFASSQPSNVISVLSMPGNGSGQGVYSLTPASTLSTSTTIVIYNRTFSVNSLTTGLSAPALTTYTPAVVSAPQTYVQTSFTSTRTTESNTYGKTTVRSDTASTIYIIPGTFTWIAPLGVTSVSVLAIGGGGGGAGGDSGGGGGGGAFSARNAITVVPGTSYSLRVGAGGNGGGAGRGSGGPGGFSGFGSPEVATAAGGQGGGFLSSGPGGSGSNGQFNFTGGSGGSASDSGGGGGGAAGYSGNGGAGGAGNAGGAPGVAGTSGTGGGGGGGGGGYYSVDVTNNLYAPGGSGGSVGILGQGANGAGGTSTGSGGVGSPSGGFSFGNGGAGGGWFYFCNGCPCSYFSFNYGGAGGTGGAVRIMWGNTTRAFPSTNAGVP